MTNVVFAHYTATREQRTDVLRTAAYLIEQNGYTPQQVDAHDERITLTDALTYASRRYLNSDRAWNDAMFLVNARLANQGALDGDRTWQAWCDAQTWETAARWLVNLADVVQDGMR